MTGIRLALVLYFFMVGHKEEENRSITSKSLSHCLSLERYRQGPIEIPGGGRRGSGEVYLTLHSHHCNNSAFKWTAV